MTARNNGWLHGCIGCICNKMTIKFGYILVSQSSLVTKQDTKETKSPMPHSQLRITCIGFASFDFKIVQDSKCSYLIILITTQLLQLMLAVVFSLSGEEDGEVLRRERGRQKPVVTMSFPWKSSYTHIQLTRKALVDAIACYYLWVKLALTFTSPTFCVQLPPPNILGLINFFLVHFASKILRTEFWVKISLLQGPCNKARDTTSI